MDYWIDGYNFMFKLKEHTEDLHQERKSLIDELKLHLIKSNMRAKVIFDSAEEHSSDFPSTTSSIPLDVVFSPKGLSADDYILELLSVSKSPKNTSIVTNDVALSFSCKEYDAKTISVDSFFHLIFKEENKRHMSSYEFLKEEGVEFENSEEHIQLFAKIFEDRLKRSEED